MRAAWAASLALLLASPARARGDVPKPAEAAAPPPVVLLSSLTPEGSAAEQAQELDATLRDAIPDLGFPAPLAAPPAGATRDVDLVERAAQGPRGAWVVSPRVEPQDGAFLVRVLAVAPGSKEVRTRVELVKAPDVAARGLVMLRDLLRAPATQAPPAPCPPATAPAPPARSAGRAPLAINGGVYGGFVAYGLHRVTRADEGFGDPRVAIPLAALGAGVGLGASLLVAEEWDISPAAAWFITGGTWWGVTTGFFLASGYDVAPLNDRFYWGIGGGAIGLTLASTALALRRVDEGGMLLTHSSAAVGLLVGGLVEVIANGPNDPFARPPPLGWGYGTAFGLVAGGALASFVHVPPSRVLLVDVGAVLGGLAGAAAGSPLIVDNKEPDKTRAWAMASIGGAVLGTGAALWLTRKLKTPVAWRWGTPYAGVIAGAPGRDGAAPALGLGWTGAW